MKNITLDEFIEEEKKRDPEFKKDFEKGYGEFLKSLEKRIKNGY